MFTVVGLSVLGLLSKSRIGAKPLPAKSNLGFENA
jgi:hypothetical protein